MSRLYAVAWDLGMRSLVLQTGDRQGEALALYARQGWVSIPPYAGAHPGRGTIHLGKVL